MKSLFRYFIFAAVVIGLFAVSSEAKSRKASAKAKKTQVSKTKSKKSQRSKRSKRSKRKKRVVAKNTYSGSQGVSSQGSRGLSSIGGGAGKKALDVRGQSRNLNMMLILKSKQDKISFIKLKTNYKQEIVDTPF